MVIKVYVSGISASKEVKKRQQRALLILDSAKVQYEPIDITEPGRDEERTRLQEISKEKETPTTPLPPQFFNGDDYCGDFEEFNLAVDVNKILQFLKIETVEEEPSVKVPVEDRNQVIRTEEENHNEIHEEPPSHEVEEHGDSGQDESGENNATVDEEVVDVPLATKRKEFNENGDENQIDEDENKKLKTETEEEPESLDQVETEDKDADEEEKVEEEKKGEEEDELEEEDEVEEEEEDEEEDD